MELYKHQYDESYFIGRTSDSNLKLELLYIDEDDMPGQQTSTSDCPISTLPASVPASEPFVNTGHDITFPTTVDFGGFSSI